MRIFYHPRFKDSYRRLPEPVKTRAERREHLFRLDPFDPLLRTHKLHGKLKNQWSFSVDARHRIVFEFDGDDVTFLDIGTHEIYH